MNPIALPQLRLGGALLRRGRQLLPHPRSLPLLSFAATAARPEPQRGSRRRLRCAAVDGDGGPGEPGSPPPVPQREDSPSSGLGAALEDPPPGPGTPLVTDPLEFS
jgi:sec-independent protein translocase protein TatC